MRPRQTLQEGVEHAEEQAEQVRKEVSLSMEAEAKILSDLGEVGWEMFWIVQPHPGGSVHAYFKRPKD